MNNHLNEFIGSLFIESEFSLSKVYYNYNSDNSNDSYHFSTYLYIGYKPKGDYFIYLTVPVNTLSLFNNEIQIDLMSFLKGELINIEKINGDDIVISSSFEKNATLILIIDNNINNIDELYNKVIAIEEDPYFFKKQVLTITPNELNLIEEISSSNKSGYISYLKNIISNVDTFKEFIIAQNSEVNKKIIEYSFTAKLYEKIPFLSLSVDNSNHENLQKKINNKLSSSQKNQCDEVLQLNIDNLDNWFSKITEI